MKLATKIASGFAALLIIALALGAIAAYAMNQASGRAVGLRDQQAPAVAVANALERNSLLTMYNVRGWSMSGDPEMKTHAEDYYKLVITALDDADKLAAAQKMEALGTASTAARSAAADYLRLYNQTVVQMQAMDKSYADRAAAAATFMKPCYSYLTAQQEAMAKALKSDADKAELTERLAKINGMNDIINLGNGLRLAAFNAQVEKRAKLFEDRLSDFATIKTKADGSSSVTIMTGKHADNAAKAIHSHVEELARAGRGEPVFRAAELPVVGAALALHRAVVQALKKCDPKQLFELARALDLPEETETFAFTPNPLYRLPLTTQFRSANALLDAFENGWPGLVAADASRLSKRALDLLSRLDREQATALSAAAATER